MADLNIKFKEILNDLEENIKNKEDLEYIKTQIFKLYTFFSDEITKIEENVSSKMETIAGTESILQEKVEKLEEKISTMEKELFIDDEESDFSITCPYCNNEFIVDYDELKDEVQCPECSNIIELDWGNEEGKKGCSGNCSSCMLNEDEEDDM